MNHNLISSHIILSLFLCTMFKIGIQLHKPHNIAIYHNVNYWLC